MRVLNLPWALAAPSEHAATYAQGRDSRSSKFAMRFMSGVFAQNHKDGKRIEKMCNLTAPPCERVGIPHLRGQE